MSNYRDTRDTYYKERADRMFSRGFAFGFVACAVIVCAFIYGQREAYGATRPAPVDRVMSSPATRLATMSHFAAGIDTRRLPPHWRTWLRIGMCEQPKRGISWHDVDTDAERVQSIAWRQTYNPSFPGGLGFTRDNWRTFRRPAQRSVELMSSAPIVEQLWAAERLWRWAERTYPTNGHTAWDCSYVIGWTSSDPTDALR